MQSEDGDLTMHISDLGTPRPELTPTCRWKSPPPGARYLVDSPPTKQHVHRGTAKSTQTFLVQNFSRTLRVMDVRAENRGRPHQKLRFFAAPVMGRNFLTQGHPSIRVRNVCGKCCFFFPELTPTCRWKAPLLAQGILWIPLPPSRVSVFPFLFAPRTLKGSSADTPCLPDPCPCKGGSPTTLSIHNHTRGKHRSGSAQQMPLQVAALA